MVKDSDKLIINLNNFKMIFNKDKILVKDFILLLHIQEVENFVQPNKYNINNNSNKTIKDKFNINNNKIKFNKSISSKILKETYKKKVSKEMFKLDKFKDKELFKVDKFNSKELSIVDNYKNRELFIVHKYKNRE